MNRPPACTYLEVLLDLNYLYVLFPFVRSFQALIFPFVRSGVFPFVRGKPPGITGFCGKPTDEALSGPMSVFGQGMVTGRRSGPPGAILEASTGLGHGGRFFCWCFHPPARVAVAEAFLARRIGVVHLLSQDEEPAQRLQEAPDRTFWAWVRDVGFRHSVVSPPPPKPRPAVAPHGQDGASI